MIVAHAPTALFPPVVGSPDTPRQTPVAFAVLVARHRTACGLAQSALARRIGVDPAYVNRIERAGCGPPKRAIVLRIAEACSLSAIQTDRLLYAAGYATVIDWQAVCEQLQERLLDVAREAIEDALAAALRVGAERGYAGG